MTSFRFCCIPDIGLSIILLYVLISFFYDYTERILNTEKKKNVINKIGSFWRANWIMQKID